MPSNTRRFSAHALVAADFACWLVCAVLLSLLFASSAQEPSASTGVPEGGGDSFTIGKITVDKRARTVRFPATVNLGDGALEYLLVTDKGKTHESLFATEVSTYKLNVAMLLLGVRPTAEITEFPPEQLTADSLKAMPELAGDKVDVLVSWKQGEDVRQVHAEEWIDNRQTQAPMATGPWIYTGSVIYQKRFLAEEEGSIVALVTDPVALVNNPRAGNRDDSIWSARNDRIPKAGTPVEITFQLLPDKTTSPTQPAK